MTIGQWIVAVLYLGLLAWDGSALIGCFDPSGVRDAKLVADIGVAFVMQTALGALLFYALRRRRPKPAP